MNLVYFWISFIFLMGISETDANHYFLFCFAMYYLTYIYNRIYPTNITPKTFSMFIFFPSIIVWWILYVYNYLLSITPLDEYIVVYTILIYFYLLIYIFWESN